MIVKDKSQYSEFCKSHHKLPVYFNDWYLDYACGKENWNALIYEENEIIYGVLPYYLSKIAFIGTKIGMPKITPYMGVYLTIPEGIKNTSRSSLEKKVTTALIEAMPGQNYFSVRFHKSFTNWLPFFWKGFVQQTMYTYIISDISDLNKVFLNFKSSVRNKIRKAEQIVTVETSEDIETFYRLNKMTFDRQGMQIGYDLMNLRKMDRAFSENNARIIFFAKDKDNRFHSALYLTYDQNSANVHLVGENPELRSSGSGALLVWEAIKYTRNELGLTQFDFEGSIIEKIEENRRSYGAEQVAYHKIRKVNSFILKLAFFLNDLTGKNFMCL
ncbi:MAG: GNAT family N-acetyltransferase [Flavobacteriaceae bacterium]|nr:GNAT family N-acetyltransferase [Flavobacteriaceae bacterium]